MRVSDHDCNETPPVPFHCDTTCSTRRGRLPLRRDVCAVRTTSYFDQLWEENKGTERYFLVLSKVDPSSPSS
jgi:hypothetical protein